MRLAGIRERIRGMRSPHLRLRMAQQSTVGQLRVEGSILRTCDVGRRLIPLLATGSWERRLVQAAWAK
jgi:hypothetical protein